MDYWMLPHNFRHMDAFYIYHFTGEKIYPKDHYIYDKKISFDPYTVPHIIYQTNKKSGKSSKDLDKNYINITYIEDEDRYNLVKQCFQAGLDLG